MLLSDNNIRDEISNRGLVVKGMTDDAIGPASVDLRLSRHFVHFNEYPDPLRGAPIDPKKDHSKDGWSVEVPDGDFYMMGPGEFCLASTIERWTFPSHLAGRLEGKSSLGRLGLMVHATAGFFDPGFEGYPTLELMNLRQRSIKLYPGMPIAQMSVFSMVSASKTMYGSKPDAKYADQGQAPVQSRYHLNWENIDG